MPNEIPKPDSNIKSAIDAATALVKEVPVYQDAVQPSARQVGKSLETVTKTINIALAPIKALVWGYEQIEKYIQTTVAEKLSKIPGGNITTPSPQVVVPTIEALRYAGHDEHLRELFAKQASPSKKGYTLVARNHSYFLNMDEINSALVPAYIDNLCRLGILEIPNNISMALNDIYNGLEDDAFVQHLRTKAANENKVLEFERKLLRFTSFGKQFHESVVTPDPEWQ